MQVDFINYNYIGKVDISKIKETLELLDKSYWDVYTKRQETFQAHSQTKSLLLMWDEENIHTLEPSQKHDLFYQLEVDKFINTIEPLYKQKYGDGYFNRIILVNLLSNSEIIPHADGGPLLLARRTHIPIITNPEVFFIVDDEEKNMKEGEIWEIDNSKVHSVENLSDEDRIHFIIDYVVTK
jgi:hypothetical protein